MPAKSRRQRSLAVTPPASQAVQRLRLQRISAHLHAMGPRAVYAALIAVADQVGTEPVLAIGEALLTLEPDFLRATGSDRLPLPPLHLVQRGRS